MVAASPDRRPYYRLWAALCRSPLHRVSLAGRTPPALALSLDERWPGDPLRGMQILSNQYRFAGETVISAVPPWDAVSAGEEWQAALHGFAWLGDIAAIGSDTAAERARALTRSWLQHHERWDKLVWRADILGERLASWASHAELIVPTSGDPALRAQFLRSFARQVRHLRRSAGWEVAGLARLQAVKGLLIALLALDAGDRELDRALGLLERELKAQIRGDGADAT